MTAPSICKKCRCRMALVDERLEGYDLVCTRCGLRELVEYQLKTPHPWSSFSEAE